VDTVWSFNLSRLLRDNIRVRLVHFHSSRTAVPQKETDHLRKKRSEVAQAV
jgi:hypothetical protein